MNEQTSIRPKEAAKMLGIGLATFWRWANERPDFPKPTHLSARCTVFSVSDLCKWRDSQVPGKYQPAQTKSLQSYMAKLRNAAPDLLEAQTMGVDMNTPDFLDWLATRLVTVYGESPSVDFVVSLRARASAGRAAVAKVKGGAA